MTATPWENLPQLVEMHGGFLRWTVRELRALTGKKQTGVRVAESIQRELAAHKIGHFPPVIPRDQNAEILLYNQDKANIGAALHLARQLASGQRPESMSTNDQVRALGELLTMFSRSPEPTSSAA